LTLFVLIVSYSCDCGMFMLKYADLHSRGAPLGFTQVSCAGHLL
jgi:hypothetical protein